MFDWVKLSGAGNTFVFLPNFKNEFRGERLSQLTQKICHPTLGLGGDGAVFMRGKGNKFAWDFFNADGSLAAMCGNAARCSGYFMDLFRAGIFAHKITGTKLNPQAQFTLQTNAGEIAISVENLSYQVQMPLPGGEKFFSGGKKIKALLGLETAQIFFVDTGVPHLVFHSKKNPNEKQKLIYKQIRNKKNLSELDLSFVGKIKSGPQINVTIFWKKTATEIFAGTFERGVEDMTLACGTGAVAAALAWKKLTTKKDSIGVHVPGGTLKINLTKDQPLLSGPVAMIAYGRGGFND